MKAKDAKGQVRLSQMLKRKLKEKICEGEERMMKRAYETIQSNTLQNNKKKRVEASYKTGGD